MVQRLARTRPWAWSLTVTRSLTDGQMSCCNPLTLHCDFCSRGCLWRKPACEQLNWLPGLRLSHGLSWTCRVRTLQLADLWNEDSPSSNEFLALCGLSWLLVCFPGRCVVLKLPGKQKLSRTRRRRRKGRRGKYFSILPMLMTNVRRVEQDFVPINTRVASARCSPLTDAGADEETEQDSGLDYKVPVTSNTSYSTNFWSLKKDLLKGKFG